MLKRSFITCTATLVLACAAVQAEGVVTAPDAADTSGDGPSLHVTTDWISKKTDTALDPTDVAHPPSDRSIFKFAGCKFDMTERKPWPHSVDPPTLTVEGDLSDLNPNLVAVEETSSTPRYRVEMPTMADNVYVRWTFYPTAPEYWNHVAAYNFTQEDAESLSRGFIHAIKLCQDIKAKRLAAEPHKPPQPPRAKDLF
jgi:hypothetical protein